MLFCDTATTLLSKFIALSVCVCLYIYIYIYKFNKKLCQHFNNRFWKTESVTLTRTRDMRA